MSCNKLYVEEFHGEQSFSPLWGVNPRRTIGTSGLLDPHVSVFV